MPIPPVPQATAPPATTGRRNSTGLNQFPEPLSDKYRRQQELSIRSLSGPARALMARDSARPQVRARRRPDRTGRRQSLEAGGGTTRRWLAERRFTTFNLSFLDIMSCGFGAVVLVFLIIDHAIEVESEELNTDLMSEVNLLEEEVLRGQSRAWSSCAIPSPRWISTSSKPGPGHAHHR